MSDVPTQLRLGNFPKFVSPMAPPTPTGRVIKLGGIASASAAWPSANLALFFPFEVQKRENAQLMTWFNGATASGNVDVGIYDKSGSRLVSIGSTAQSGTSTIQQVNITDTELKVGKYYMAIAMDNTTGTMSRQSVTAVILAACGVKQMASAFPLPSTATFAVMAQTYVPILTVQFASVA